MKTQDDDVVISGCGVISPWGNSHEEVFKALINEQKTDDNFKTVNDFDALKILGKSGLRAMNRASKFGVCAALDCLSDAQIEAAEIGDETGVVIGSHLGHMDDVEEFIQTIMEDGSYCLSPVKAGNGGINIMAATIGIRIGAKALNTTIHNSYTSGLDAVQYSCRSLANNYAEYILAGGIEAGSRYCMEWHKTNGSIQAFEGAGMIFLEKQRTALERGIKPLGVVKGYSTMSYYGVNSIIKSINLTLKSAGLGIESIDAFVGSGDFSVEQVEEKALSDLGYTGPSRFVRQILGEGLSVNGIFQIMVGINFLQNGCRNVLVHVFGNNGSTSAMIFSSE
ncbi:MAG: beta-ketoacyl synthase N-terminal-like domain-containing protein [Candidatus Pacearchaeota archaeon]|nr:beta-ketoacyl synthase N-terminal-like domain-containing protein [Candidatus Pacearchaeota archaeon]